MVPWCLTISSWTEQKFKLARRTGNRLQPVVALAHIIVESNWGNHPLSKELLDKKPANNMALLEVDSMWLGKHHKMEMSGKAYKVYVNLNHFASDYSDSLVFTGALSPIIEGVTVAEQVAKLAALKDDPKVYEARLNTIIEFYSLDKLF